MFVEGNAATQAIKSNDIICNTLTNSLFIYFLNYSSEESYQCLKKHYWIINLGWESTMMIFTFCPGTLPQTDIFVLLGNDLLYESGQWWVHEGGAGGGGNMQMSRYANEGAADMNILDRADIKAQREGKWQNRIGVGIRIGVMH